jgi:hypothetical protein
MPEDDLELRILGFQNRGEHVEQQVVDTVDTGKRKEKAE